MYREIERGSERGLVFGQLKRVASMLHGDVHHLARAWGFWAKRIRCLFCVRRVSTVRFLVQPSGFSEHLGCFEILAGLT